MKITKYYPPPRWGRIEVGVDMVYSPSPPALSSPSQRLFRAGSHQERGWIIGIIFYVIPNANAQMTKTICLR